MQTPLPDPQQPVAPPIPLPTRAPGSGAGPDNTVGGMIPTGNPSALWAYYLGLFCGLPLFGLAMAPIAVHMGLKGLRLSKENPSAKGATHAWVGIVCGVIGTLLHYTLLIGLIFAMLESRK